MSDIRRYSTEKVENRIKTLKKYAIAIIGFGILILAFKDYDQIRADGAFIGGFLDSAVFISLGVLTYLNSIKQEKRIKGSFIEFGNKDFSFKSNQIEKKLSLTDLSDIEIKLKSIELSASDGSEYSINLDDYAQVKDKKEIKNEFEVYRNQIQS
ncbi:hypothetical protein O3Q51_11775 [Cryomorphaceae bacterium 1068]|nr:hypothetical protein [Cryomorphaceae bacterium 1068]